MAGIWVRYNAALAAKPLQTKTLTSLTGFVLGDLVAQAPDLSAGKAWDARRTAKMGGFGVALHGPIGHYWYGFLDRTIMTHAPTSAKAVFSKTAIDQLMWAPIFTGVFFGSMKVMDGKPGEIGDEIKEKLWPTMKVNCTCCFSCSWTRSLRKWMTKRRERWRLRALLSMREELPSPLSFSCSVLVYSVLPALL